jgi:hypothetical protein
MERPEGNQDAEAKEQQAKNLLLDQEVNRMLRNNFAQRDEVEGSRAAFPVERDQAEQRNQRPGRGRSRKRKYPRSRTRPSTPPA